MEPNYKPTQIDVLGMARELLLDKYVEAKEYQLFCWRLSDGSTPWPTIPEYPTEEEILDLARKLWWFFNEGSGNVYITPTTNVGNVHTTFIHPMPNVGNTCVTSFTVS